MRMNRQIHEEEDANHAHKPYKEGPARRMGALETAGLWVFGHGMAA